MSLAEMFIDEGAEFERPERFALIDAITDQMKIVQLPQGVSHSFRSPARGAQAEAIAVSRPPSLMPWCGRLFHPPTTPSLSSPEAIVSIAPTSRTEGSIAVPGRMIQRRSRTAVNCLATGLVRGS
ncbi:hypothetical protein [Mycobacterium sp. 48b]|uniref:hypothetical protein n=1 Tax=Mycobacterium sp. 48b TaxID=3400426 RepID=UPI003AB09B3C